VLKRLNDEGPVRIHPTLLAAHTLPPEFAARRGEYVRWVAEELIPEVAREKLAISCDAFCDDHAFTVDEARVVMRAAQLQGLNLRIHAEQFRAGTGAALAAELGAATADHLEVVEAAELVAGACDGGRGIGGGDCNGFQSGVVANCVDAVYVVACLCGDEVDAGGGVDCDDD
jgi:imidazolonepropionase